MEPAVTFDFEYEIAAGSTEVEACLLDPLLLARCVPGASLIAADGSAITGRVRIKQASVPSVYALQAELGRATGDPGDQAVKTMLAVDGVAEEQRTGLRLPFRIRVGLTSAGPGRTWCRVTAEVPAGDDTRPLLDRLMPQFVRRLEDLALELPEIPAAVGEPPNPQEPQRCPAAARLPGSRVKARVPGAVAGVTAAAVLLLWSERRRRRTGAPPF